MNYSRTTDSRETNNISFQTPDMSTIIGSLSIWRKPKLVFEVDHSNRSPLYIIKDKEINLNLLKLSVWGFRKLWLVLKALATFNWIFLLMATFCNQFEKTMVVLVINNISSYLKNSRWCDAALCRIYKVWVKMGFLWVFMMKNICITCIPHSLWNYSILPTLF